MTAFQFDKCFDDLVVIEACNAEKTAEVLRLDERLWKAKDPELLQILMQRPNPMVTIDRALPRKHSAHIPDLHPGIVVLAYSQYIDRTRETLKTMTTKSAARILQQFKRLIPEWHQLPVNNSIVEITNKGVEVSHVEHGQMKFDKYLEYEQIEGLKGELTAVLRTNSQRSPASEES